MGAMKKEKMIDIRIIVDFLDDEQLIEDIETTLPFYTVSARISEQMKSSDYFVELAIRRETIFIQKSQIKSIKVRKLDGISED